jgi:hypothetical protein
MEQVLNEPQMLQTWHQCWGQASSAENEADALKLAQMLDALATLKQPTIARVHGPAKTTTRMSSRVLICLKQACNSSMTVVLKALCNS